MLFAHWPAVMRWRTVDCMLSLCAALMYSPLCLSSLRPSIYSNSPLPFLPREDPRFHLHLFTHLLFRTQYRGLDSTTFTLKFACTKADSLHPAYFGNRSIIAVQPVHQASSFDQKESTVPSSESHADRDFLLPSLHEYHGSLDEVREKAPNRPVSRPPFRFSFNI